MVSVATLIWLMSTIFIVSETGNPAPESSVQSITAVYLGFFRHKGFLGFMLTHSIAYAGGYCFITGAPYFFIEGLAVKPGDYGVIAAIVMSGFLTGSTFEKYAIPRWGMKRVILIGFTIMLSASVIILCLGIIGRLPVLLFVVVEFMYFCGNGLLLPNTAAGVTLSHLQVAGAASAVLGFFQMVGAAAIAYLQGLINDGTILPIIGTQFFLGLVMWIIWDRLQRYAGIK